MSKLSKLVLLVLASCIFFPFSAFALTGDSFSWYCKRNSEHRQPQIDPEMRFIEEHNGYYVDRKYADNKEKVR